MVSNREIKYQQPHHVTQTFHKRSASLQTTDYQLLVDPIENKHFLASDHFAVNDDDDEFIYIDSCLADDNGDDPDYSFVTATNCAHNNDIKQQNDRNSFVLRLPKCHHHHHHHHPRIKSSINNIHCHAQHPTVNVDGAAALRYHNNNNSECAKNNNIDVVNNEQVKNNDQLIIENDPDCDDGIGSGSISPQPLASTPSSLSPSAPLSPSNTICSRNGDVSATAATTTTTIQYHHGHQRSPPFVPQPSTNNKLCSRTTSRIINNELNNNKNGADHSTLIICDSDDNNRYFDASRASLSERYSDIFSADIIQTAGKYKDNENDGNENCDAFVAVNRSKAPAAVTTVATTSPLLSARTNANDSVNSAHSIRKLSVAIDCDDNHSINNNFNGDWPSAVLLAEASLRAKVQSAKKWNSNNESSKFIEIKSAVVPATGAVATDNNRNNNNCLVIDSSNSVVNSTKFSEDNLVYIGNKAIPVPLFNRRIYRRYRRVSLDNPFLLTNGYRETAFADNCERFDNNDSLRLPVDINVSIWLWKKYFCLIIFGVNLEF